MHDTLDLADFFSLDRLNAAANQLPFIKAVRREIHAFICRHRQIVAYEFSRFFNSIETGKPEHDAIAVKPLLFNLQRSTSSIRRNTDQRYQLFKAFRKIR